MIGLRVSGPVPLEQRRHHLAPPAPRRIKIHHDRNGRRKDFLFKIGLGQLVDVFHCRIHRYCWLLSQEAGKSYTFIAGIRCPPPVHARPSARRYANFALSTSASTLRSGLKNEPSSAMAWGMVCDTATLQYFNEPFVV